MKLESCLMYSQGILTFFGLGTAYRCILNKCVQNVFFGAFLGRANRRILDTECIYLVHKCVPECV